MIERSWGYKGLKGEGNRNIGTVRTRSGFSEDPALSGSTVSKTVGKGRSWREGG